MEDATSDGLMSIDTLSKHLAVSKDTIYGYRSAGKSFPPAIKVGKHLRWRRSDVEAWLDEHAEDADTNAGPDTSETTEPQRTSTTYAGQSRQRESRSAAA